MNKLDRPLVTLTGLKSELTITRTNDGVPQVKAKNLEDLLFGFGVAQARDRLMQMTLMRTLAAGAAAHKMESAAYTLELDRFFRRIGLGSSVRRDLAEVHWDKDMYLWLTSFLEGVNFYVAQGTPPLSMRLARIKPEPFVIEDCLRLFRITAYIGLVQVQEEIERSIIAALIKGADPATLQHFFAPHLEDLDPTVVQGLHIPQRLSQQATAFLLKTMPPLTNSNNWAISGKRTASGSPVFAGDPHMDTSNIPQIWHEIVLECPEFKLMGAAIPGLPGLGVGRNRHLAWSPTYSSLDSLDIFVEEVNGDSYLSPTGWQPLLIERHKIYKRRGSPEDYAVYRTEHGALDCPPERPGRYLAVNYAFMQVNVVDTLSGLITMNRAATVEEAMTAVRTAQGPGFTWALADDRGAIGLQVSGAMPKRRPGRIGLAPCAGWAEDHQWLGLESPDLLPSVYNPESGYVVSSNNDLNQPGLPTCITVSMAGDRAARIASVLASRTDWSPTALIKLQTDLYSLRAERYLTTFRDVFETTPEGRNLLQWDRAYSPQSTMASLFDRIVWRLSRDVLAAVFGQEVSAYLIANTTLPIFYAGLCERMIMADASIAQRLKELLNYAETSSSWRTPWSQRNTFTMQQMVLGSRFPKLAHALGLNVGPIPLPGGRDVVSQGIAFAPTCSFHNFSPSYRFLTDLGTTYALTNQPIGPSERRFSGYYASEVKAWLAGIYKTIEWESEAEP